MSNYKNDIEAFKFDLLLGTMGVEAFRLKGSYTKILSYQPVRMGVEAFRLKGSYTNGSASPWALIGVEAFRLKGSYT